MSARLHVQFVAGNTEGRIRADAARRFAETDPYVRNGLVARWEVRPWITVAGDMAATPVRPENLS